MISHINWELDQEDLHSTSLEFRLLKQHKYVIPEDVFKRFTDKGRFIKSLHEDVKGMLSLFEASYYAYEGESLMEEAWYFTKKNPREFDGRNIGDPHLAMHVKHALELPLHWRMQWLEARRYIDMYEKSSDMIPALLELAKLNSNHLQALYQEELESLSGWLKKTGLAEKLSFTRDRLVSSFLWAVATTFEPQFKYCRIESTKQILLITLIDDVYDVLYIGRT